MLTHTRHRYEQGNITTIFFHTGGDAVPTLLCPAGHYCEAGSITPSPCEAGTHVSNMTGQGKCEDCPSGYYCEDGASKLKDCPEGHYCLANTEFSKQYPCPNGTYNNRTNLQSESDCLACSPGYYCGEPGLVIPSGPCSAGFYCLSGAKEASPQTTFKHGYEGDTCVDQSDSGTNDLCPPGTRLFMQNYIVPGWILKLMYLMVIYRSLLPGWNGISVKVCLRF